MRFRLFALDDCRLERARNHVTRPRPVGPVAAWSDLPRASPSQLCFSLSDRFANPLREIAALLEPRSDQGPRPNLLQSGLRAVWPSRGRSFSLEPDRRRAGRSRGADGPLQHVPRWADEANAAANLAYQRAVGQAIQNQQQAMQARIDVRQRFPQRAIRLGGGISLAAAAQRALKEDGRVAWPASAPSGGPLDQSKSAAETAIRIAVKEYASAGKATIQSVAEAQRQLVLYGKPALEELARANRGDAEKLLTFLASLEQVLNELAGGA